MCADDFIDTGNDTVKLWKCKVSFAQKKKQKETQISQQKTKNF